MSCLLRHFVGSSFALSEFPSRKIRNHHQGKHHSSTTTKLPPKQMPVGEAKLFIGQLHFDATEDDVRQLFEYYGEVRHINILRDKNSGRSTGSAFVTFGSTEEADASILALHNIYNMERDKPLQVSYCERTATISQFGYEHAERLATENRANPRPRPIL